MSQARNPLPLLLKAWKLALATFSYNYHKPHHHRALRFLLRGTHSTMPLASSGARGLAFTGRQASHALGHGRPAKHARDIHIPSSSFVPQSTATASKAGASTTQTVIKQTRTLFSRFVTLLTAPAKYATPAHIPASLGGGARFFGNAATQSRSIQQGLSFTTRQTLARPMWAPCLPKPPAVQRRVVDVGLGTARKFSTGRPIFQSVADNMPIAGRAFWEADWQMKVGEEKKKLELKQKERKLQEKENKKPRAIVFHSVSQPEFVDSASIASTSSASIDDVKEFDYYFPNPPKAEVATYLLIPLVPTPSSRLPLPVSPPSHRSSHPLLPFSLLSSIHNDHSTHALRVSTLFSRLDSQRIFSNPSVSCSTFGDRSGLCTILEVKFEGWSEDKVRGVLGELGTGWCVLEEVREDLSQEEQEAMENELEEMSNTSVATPVDMDIGMDPASSFVLPTLDFSAAFPAPSHNSWASAHAGPQYTTPALEDLEFHNAWTNASLSGSESDFDSDIDFSSDVEGSVWEVSSHLSRASAVPSVPRSVSSGSGEGWIPLSFNSQFSRRVQEYEPREYLF